MLYILDELVTIGILSKFDLDEIKKLLDKKFIKKAKNFVFYKKL